MRAPQRSVGLVGARGYAGREFLRFVASHPGLTLAFAASRSRAGTSLADSVPEWEGAESFVAAAPGSVADHDADVVVLALPNDLSAEYVAALADDTLVVDLSADHRFDEAWAYGLPELHREDLKGARRIANPGCYATAAMLGLAPLAGMLAAQPSIFGVSGFSGAGTDPSPKNDPATLSDNVMPYRLTGHVHEREISHQFGREVRFAPSVAPFERGLVVTILAEVNEPTEVATLLDLFEAHYGRDELIEVRAEMPLPRAAAGGVGATIGGISVDREHPTRVGFAVALDNLLKGASSQAVQNINVAFDLNPLEGLSRH